MGVSCQPSKLFVNTSVNKPMFALFNLPKTMATLKDPQSLGMDGFARRFFNSVKMDIFWALVWLFRCYENREPTTYVGNGVLIAFFLIDALSFYRLGSLVRQNTAHSDLFRASCLNLFVNTLLIIYYIPRRTYCTFVADDLKNSTLSMVLDGAFLILIIGGKILGLCVVVAFRKLMANAEV